jgi:hypothetical protein
VLGLSVLRCQSIWSPILIHYRLGQRVYVHGLEISGNRGRKGAAGNGPGRFGTSMIGQRNVNYSQMRSSLPKSEPLGKRLEGSPRSTLPHPLTSSSSRSQIYGVPVKDNAHSDWLDITKTRAQCIRASVGASILLIFLIGLMLWGQRQQLREDEQKEGYTACFSPSLPIYLTPTRTGFGRRSNACPSEALLDQIQIIYEGFPHKEIEEELVAWNNFAWVATQDATFVRGSERINGEAQNGGQPPIVQILRRQGSLRAITTFQIHLRMYTENFKVVEDAAKAGIPFTDLTAGKLVALMLAYQFEFAEADAWGRTLPGLWRLQHLSKL